MDLKNVSTKALVEELASREAVEKTVIEPYEEYSITVGEEKINDAGPVVILRIWDQISHYIIFIFYNLGFIINHGIM